LANLAESIERRRIPSMKKASQDPDVKKATRDPDRSPTDISGDVAGLQGTPPTSPLPAAAVLPPS
jgi:hypothetical protein